jgi:hypothetical protein
MDWKEVLEKARKELLHEQLAHKAEIVEAFREMWHSSLTEKEFGEIVDGLIVAPEMFYIMVHDHTHIGFQIRLGEKPVERRK